MLQDLRIAARALRRNPVFSATSVAVLALGIGANSAVFGLVNQALFSPDRACRNPTRVVAVRARYLEARHDEHLDLGPRLPRRQGRARRRSSRTAVAQGSDVVLRAAAATPRVLARVGGVARVVRRVRRAPAARPDVRPPRRTRKSGQRAVVLAHAAWVRRLRLRRVGSSEG